MRARIMTVLTAIAAFFIGCASAPKPAPVAEPVPVLEPTPVAEVPETRPPPMVTAAEAPDGWLQFMSVAPDGSVKLVMLLKDDSGATLAMVTVEAVPAAGIDLPGTVAAIVEAIKRDGGVPVVDDALVTQGLAKIAYAKEVKGRKVAGELVFKPDSGGRGMMIVVEGRWLASLGDAQYAVIEAIAVSADCK